MKYSTDISICTAFAHRWTLQDNINECVFSLALDLEKTRYCTSSTYGNHFSSSIHGDLKILKHPRASRTLNPSLARGFITTHRQFVGKRTNHSKHRYPLFLLRSGLWLYKPRREKPVEKGSGLKLSRSIAWNLLVLVFTHYPCRLHTHEHDRSTAAQITE